MCYYDLHAKYCEGHPGFPCGKFFLKIDHEIPCDNPDPDARYCVKQPHSIAVAGVPHVSMADGPENMGSIGVAMCPTCAGREDPLDEPILSKASDEQPGSDSDDSFWGYSDEVVVLKATESVVSYDDEPGGAPLTHSGASSPEADPEGSGDAPINGSGSSSPGTNSTQTAEADETNDWEQVDSDSEGDDGSDGIPELGFVTVTTLALMMPDPELE